MTAHVIAPAHPGKHATPALSTKSAASSAKTAPAAISFSSALAKATGSATHGSAPKKA
jgi:hypothetical protein